MSGLGEMGNLLKQAQEMQRQIDRVRSELKSRLIEGQAGGGMVRVEVTADRHEIKKVEIAAEVRGSADPSLLEDLVLAATQDALRRAAEVEKEAIGRITGGVHLPGLF